MKIVLDATSIRSHPSGIGIYIKNLIQGLLRLSLEQIGISLNLKLLYRDRHFQHGLQQSNIHKIKENLLSFFYYPLPSSGSLQFLEQFNFLAALSENILQNPHIFHGLDYLNYPFSHSYNVITIHDLSFIKYPAYSPDRILKTYQNRLERCLKWTDLIVTVSENSKRDIIDCFGIAPETIWVTPLASRYPNPRIDRLMKPDFSYPSPFPFPYLLFVGTLEPRKNIKTLIQAFEHLKSSSKIPHHLVLIGQKGWKYESILHSIAHSPFHTEIHRLDYLQDEQVAVFYQHATVFVYPSYYEGFGLPVLEAMNFGIPVVTSDRASLPEVTGNAALLVNPDNPIALATAILEVIENTQLRQNLSEKGKERSAFFSWETTALKTLKAYQSLL